MILLRRRQFGLGANILLKEQFSVESAAQTIEMSWRHAMRSLIMTNSTNYTNKPENRNVYVSHLMMHGSHQEKVQRLLIALVKGSYVEPHYHELPHQWEMFIVMRGNFRFVCTVERWVIKQFIAGDNTGISIVEFSPGDIHSVECLSPRALMVS